MGSTRSQKPPQTSSIGSPTWLIKSRSVWKRVKTLTDILFELTGLGREGSGTHSSTLAWKIPWTEEPGRLQSVGL